MQLEKKRSSQTVCSFHRPSIPWSNMKPRQASVALTPYGLRKILAVTINDFFQHYPSASSDKFRQCLSSNSWPCTRTYEKSEWRWMLCGMALCLETAFSAALAMRDAYRSFQLENLLCCARLRGCGQTTSVITKIYAVLRLLLRFSLIRETTKILPTWIFIIPRWWRRSSLSGPSSK